MIEFRDNQSERRMGGMLRPLSSKVRMKRSCQLQQPLETKKKKLKLRWKKLKLRWWHAIFLLSIASLLFCLLQISLPPPFGLLMKSSEIALISISFHENGCDDGVERCICPRETICATNNISMVLLALARCSAFFDYPLYAMMFLSKAHNVNNILRRTVLREWIDFADMHRIHYIFGIVIGIESAYHSFFHVLRWTTSDEIRLLWSTTTGITGMVAIIATPFIVLPMAVPKLKARLSFEVRKALHYQFFIWAVALMWHAPSRIYFIIGIPFLIYAIDCFVGLFMRNYLIENVYFERFGEEGIALHFENPKGYCSQKTSYVYIMCPWISKWQWHAFTTFPEPTKEDHTMICIKTSGDWTEAMYDMIKSPCLRPVYITGPFSSEFSDKAVDTTNAIAIASGIGITPALSLMQTYAGKKRINMIWMCRDAGLIEYFLHKFDIESVTKNSFALIFYTGCRDLLLPEKLPLNFFIFRSRPNLEETISGIVAAIHSGEGLPEKMYEKQKALADIPFEKRIRVAINRIVTIYSKEEMFEYAVDKTYDESPADDHSDLEAGKGKDTPTDKVVLFSDSHTSQDAIDESFQEDSKSSSFIGSINSPKDGLETETLADEKENVVSVNGLEAMICSFLGGIGEYSRADIAHFFGLVDTDESGYIDKEEFDHFFDLVTGEEYSYCSTTARHMGLELEGSNSSTMGDSVRRATTVQFAKQPTHFRSRHSRVQPRKELMIGDRSTIQYMENLVIDTECPLRDWSLFYCGASTPIENALRSISKKYKISVGVEKFDW